MTIAGREGRRRSAPRCTWGGTVCVGCGIRLPTCDGGRRCVGAGRLHRTSTSSGVGEQPVPRRCAVVLTIGTVFAIGGCGGPSHPRGPTGDPGRAILAELSSVRQAVPAGAQTVKVLRVEPHDTGSCWSTTPNVNVDVLFRTPVSVDQIATGVGRKLTAAGWSSWPAREPAGTWYGVVGGQRMLTTNDIWRWQRHLPQKVSTTATLQVATPTGGQQPGQSLLWDLGASAPAVGGPKLHCTSG